MLHGDFYGVIKISGIDEEVSGQLFTRLCKRPIGQQPLPIAHPDAGRGDRRLQDSAGDILTGGIQPIDQPSNAPGGSVAAVSS
jgi:hypothetical protein